MFIENKVFIESELHRSDLYFNNPHARTSVMHLYDKTPHFTKNYTTSSKKSAIFFRKTKRFLTIQTIRQYFFIEWAVVEKNLIFTNDRIENYIENEFLKTGLSI